MKPLFYIASPYSNPDKAVVDERVRQVTEFCARCFEAGLHVFSPIVYSHPIAMTGKMGGDFETWREFDLRMIDLCDAVILFAIEGYDKSVGVSREIEYAEEKKKPIFSVDKSTNEMSVLLKLTNDLYAAGITSDNIIIILEVIKESGKLLMSKESK